MKRVLITGADGFTGRYLARELIEVGYETHGLVRSPIDLPEYQALHIGDLKDTDRLHEIIKQVRPSYVVHLAAISFVAHGDVDEIYKVNVLGTRHLLEALVRSGAKPDAVLLASSANVYGNVAIECIDEDVQPAPSNDYAVSKLAMEYVSKLIRERLPIIIARPFNYTGVGQSGNFLLPKIVDHFRWRAKVIELGNVDVARDFTDVRVVTNIYRRLLESPAAVGHTFNVCSGKAYTLNEVIQIASEISGHVMDVKVNPDFVRANEVKRLQGSRKKLETIIGHVEDIALKDTLRWMLGV